MNSIISTCAVFAVMLISLDCTYADEDLVSKSSSVLETKLMHALFKGTDNILVSPLGLNFALATLSIGATSDSYDELTKVMGVSNYTVDEIKEAYKHYTDLLKDDDSNLAINTKIFINNRYDVDTSYLANISEYFDSDIEEIDFDNSTAAKEQIDQWIQAFTDYKIDGSTPKGDIDSLTAAVLLNAVLFESDWLHPFDVRLTKPGKFHGFDGVFEIPMMTVRATFGFMANQGAEVVALPYKSNYTMILTRPIINVPEQKFSAAHHNVLMEGLQPRDMILTIPKFSLEVTNNGWNLLHHIGVDKIFSPGSFNITTTPNVAIQNVFHKTYLAVNEKSTEAAAATGEIDSELFVESTSGRSLPIMLRVDTPFYFHIVDRNTNLCVFSGRFGKEVELS